MFRKADNELTCELPVEVGDYVTWTIGQRVPAFGIVMRISPTPNNRNLMRAYVSVGGGRLPMWVPFRFLSRAE